MPLDGVGGDLPASSGLPLVVLTAEERATTRERALAGGASTCLSKPADGKTLLGAIAAATCEMARELLIVDRTAAVPGEGISATQTSEASHGRDAGTSSMTSTTFSKGDNAAGRVRQRRS